MPAVLMQNRFVRVSKKNVERKQTMVGFAVTKAHRLCCNVHFNYCGKEMECLIEAMDVLRRGVSKLVVHGWLLVTNDLLEWLVTEFPLLTIIIFRLEDPQCNRVTRKGIDTAMAMAPHLRKLQILVLDRMVLGTIIK